MAWQPEFSLKIHLTLSYRWNFLGNTLDILTNVTKITGYPVVAFVGCHPHFWSFILELEMNPQDSCMIGRSLPLGSAQLTILCSKRFQAEKMEKVTKHSWNFMGTGGINGWPIELTTSSLSFPEYFMHKHSLYWFFITLFFNFCSSTHFHPVNLKIYKYTKVSSFCLQLNNFPL